MSHPLLPRREHLLQVNRAEGAHRVALRAGVSVAVPLVLVLLAGRPQAAPYASFGAFASLYGRNLPHLIRVQMQLSAAAVFTCTIGAAVLVGTRPSATWLHVAVAGVVAAVGQVMARAHSYHPPGPLFMVFAYGAVSSAPHHADQLGVALAVTVGASLFAVAVGGVGVLFTGEGLRRAWQRSGWLVLRPALDAQPLWMALAVVVAGTLANLLHIGHPYWAMVAALAPLSGPTITSQLVRAIHRPVGTLAGLLPAGALMALHLPGLWLVVVIACCQVGAELLIGRNYALALLCITPLALLMGQLGRPGPIGPVLLDRGVETVVGSLVGVAVALAAHLVRERRRARPEATAR